MDRSARVWAAGGALGGGRADALVVIKGEHHDVGSKVDGAGVQGFGVKAARGGIGGLLAFGHAVVDASFFYQDKYILLGMGAAVQLYKYRLPPAVSGARGLDDVQKLKKDYKYKAIHSLQSSAQSITCIAALNEILSPTVIAAGSDKSITVFDLAHRCTTSFATEVASTLTTRQLRIRSYCRRPQPLGPLPSPKPTQ